MRPRLFVTGALGVVGRVLSPELKGRYEVIAVDRRSDGDAHRVDIADRDELEAVFQRFGGFDAVLHLAADSRPEGDWPSILHNNIIGTKNVYDLALDYRVRRVVFASTNRVTQGYEQAHPVPMITASHAVRPMTQLVSCLAKPRPG